MTDYEADCWHDDDDGDDDDDDDDKYHNLCNHDGA